MCCSLPLTGYMQTAKSGTVIDYTPRDAGDWVIGIARQVEILEKCLEVIDELCHLFSPGLRRVVSSKVYRHLDQLHEVAHECEHLLHGLCGLSDLGRLLKRRFFERNKYVVNAARVMHAVAHIFGFTALLVAAGLFSPAFPLLDIAVGCALSGDILLLAHHVVRVVSGGWKHLRQHRLEMSRLVGLCVRNGVEVARIFFVIPARSFVTMIGSLATIVQALIGLYRLIFPIHTVL